MSATDLAIIAIATISAIAFKWWLVVRIRRWMDRDLICGLSGGDSDKRQQLQNLYDSLSADKTPRREIHQQLELLAKSL